MTTITSVQVPELLQSLIDSRLDTIDRMLLGRLARSERLEIVREVESQIFELLQERCSDEPTREDVLAVLARLDPPEAYLSADLEREREPGPRPRHLVGGADLLQSRGPLAGKDRRKTTLVSGLLGIASILVLVFTFPLVNGIANVTNPGIWLLVPWYMLTGISFCGSGSAISLAFATRLQGHWAVTGLVTGSIALLGSLCFVVLGMFL